jgi:hypothetical protein
VTIQSLAGGEAERVANLAGGNFVVANEAGEDGQAGGIG